MTQSELLLQFNTLISTSRAFRGIPPEQQESIKKDALTATVEQLAQMIQSIQDAEKKMPSLEEEQKKTEALLQLIRSSKATLLKVEEKQDEQAQSENLKSLEAEFTTNNTQSTVVTPPRKKFLGLF